MPKTPFAAPMRRGFSLTDTSVAILVIAILMAILFPAIRKAYQTTQKNRITADLQAVATALEAFRMDTGDYPRVDLKSDRKSRGAEALFAGLIGTYDKDTGAFTAGFRTGRGKQVGPYLTLDKTPMAKTQDGNGMVLLDKNGMPILYYLAHPVRRDLSARDSYVSTMVPNSVGVKAPLFNAYDNSEYLFEPYLQQLLGAENDGALRVSSDAESKRQLGAYVLISAGIDGMFNTADDIMIGGGQSTMGATPLGARVGDLYASSRLGLTAPAAPPPLYQFGGTPGVWRTPPARSPSVAPAGAISVLDYGADPTGQTDSTAAIQRAIDAAGGGAIVFPEGTFKISNTLKLRSGGSYYGPGIINMVGNGKFAAEINNQQNVTIDGLTFAGKGIKLEGNTSGTTIVNTLFADIGGGGVFSDAIYAPTGLKNSTIMYNQFINVAGNGVMATGLSTESIINSNYFQDVWEGIHIWTDGGQNLQMSDNIGVGFKRMGIEFQGTNHNGALVENNQFSEWRDRYHESFGLSIVNWGTNTVVRNNVMASGKIGEVDPGANHAPVGIEIMGRNSTVEGNSVYGFREGIHVGPSTTNSVFQNNLLDNQANMAFWHTGLGNSQNVQVKNNTINTPNGTAFLITGGGHDGTVISGNNITLKRGKSLIAGGEKVNVGQNNISYQ